VSFAFSKTLPGDKFVWSHFLFYLLFDFVIEAIKRTLEWDNSFIVNVVEFHLAGLALYNVFFLHGFEHIRVLSQQKVTFQLLSRIQDDSKVFTFLIPCGSEVLRFILILRCLYKKILFLETKTIIV